MNEDTQNEEPTIDATLAAKLEEVRKKLGEKAAEGTGVATEEEPEGVTAAPDQLTGADVDWSLYDLPAHTAHLYPRATLVQRKDGPTWVVEVDDFYVLRASYEKLGLRMSQMVNGPEAWMVLAPASAGGSISRGHGKGKKDISECGAAGIVTLHRKAKVALPMPELLKTTEEDKPAEPKPEELTSIENDALAWANAGKEELDERGAALPKNAVSDALAGGDVPLVSEEGSEEQPSRANIVPAARAAAAEYLKAQEDDVHDEGING